jgi:hypothetical protein
MWSDECSFRERHSSSPGSRTSGQTAQDLLIAGPSWHGSVPRNLTLVRSSTNTAFIIGRVYSDGTPPDLAQVHKLQAEFKLVPLSSFNKPFTPLAGQTGGPYAPKEIVRNVIAKMTASEYFNFMADAMKENPPVMPQDGQILARMAKIGIVPGKPFDMSQHEAGLRWQDHNTANGHQKTHASQGKGNFAAVHPAPP